MESIKKMKVCDSELSQVFDVENFVFVSDKNQCCVVFDKLTFKIKKLGRVMDAPIQKLVSLKKQNEIYIGDANGSLKVLDSGSFKTKFEASRLMANPIKEFFLVDDDLVIIDAQNCIKFFNTKIYELTREVPNSAPQDPAEAKIVCNGREIFIFYPKKNMQTKTQAKMWKLKIFHLYIFSMGVCGYKTGRRAAEVEDSQDLLQKNFAFNFLILKIDSLYKICSNYNFNM
jgi:hypothetical protein